MKKMVSLIPKNFLRSFNCNSCRHLILKTCITNRLSNICLYKNSKFFWNTGISRLFCTDHKNKKWVTIIFEKPDGTQLKRRAKIGETVQEVIGQSNPDFDGFGACDGTLSCSTCHLILPKEDYSKFGKPTEEEMDILECAESLSPTSRLGCSLHVVPEMDGMVLKIPPAVKDIRES